MPENIVDEHAGTRDRSKLEALMEKKYGDEGGEDAPKGAGWEQKQWEEDQMVRSNARTGTSMTLMTHPLRFLLTRGH